MDDYNEHPRSKLCIILYLTLDTGYTISLVCLLVHLYKFFTTDKKQSLPSKNLASYCLGMVFTCASTMSLKMTPMGKGWSSPMNAISASIFWSCSLNSALLLFSMTLDTFLCLRKSVTKFRLTGGSHNETFIVYTVFSWGTSMVILVSTFAILISAAGQEQKYLEIQKLVMLSLNGTILMIHLVCFVLFCISLHYLRSTHVDDESMNTRNTRPNFAVQIRLILITGSTYMIWFIIYFTTLYIQDQHLLSYKFYPCDQIATYSLFLPPFEGIFIFFGFTVKKGMFEDEKEEKSARWNRRASTMVKFRSSTK